jgi:hypothetical protein
MAIGLITIVALLAYAPLLGRLGFYRDDWYQIWAGDTLGPGSIITLFSIDRPVMGYLYAAAFRLLGDAPLGWQVYAFGLRWTGALGALWLARRLWPRQPVATTSIAVLFLVYPGFLQQPNANTFSNHLFGYTAEILSLALMVESFRPAPPPRRVGLIALAILAALGSWLTYEYMIGLEALRYWLLARHALRVESEARERRWADLLAVSAPFLIPLAGFLVYRLFFFEAGRESVDVAQVLAGYQAAPVLELGRRMIALGQDFVEAVLLGWTVPSQDLLASVTTRELVSGLALAAAAVVAVLAYARRQRPEADSAADVPHRELILMGAFTVLASLAPVVLTGRDIRWASAFDRYTLHATLGIGMLIVGLVFAGLRPGSRSFVLGFLVGFSVLTHYGNAVAWSGFWNEQRQFWWQLAWRAPDLQSGTVLLTTLPSQRYFEDYEVWGPANLIYRPGQADPTIASEVMEELTAEKVRLGAREVRSMRVLIAIPRNYNQTLVAAWPSTGSCVHVLDREQLEFPASLSSLVRSLGRYSDASLILPQAVPASPPSRIFGPEPERNWCWYYQTASLARQRGEWGRVVQLADEADLLDVRPGDPTEWLPFFYGYLNAGRTDEARQLATRIGADDLVRHDLCDHLTAHYFVDEATYALGRSLLCGVR